LLRSLYRKNKGLFVVFQTSILLSSAALILGEFLKGYLLEGALSHDFTRFWHIAVIFLAVGLFNALAFFIYSRAFRIFEARSMRDIRRDYFKSLIGMPFVRFLREDKGTYLSDYTNQTDAVEYSYFQSVYGVEQIIWEILFSAVALCVIDWRFALLTFALMIPASLVPKLFKKRIQMSARASLEENNRTTAMFEDFLDGLTEIKDYGVEANFHDAFAEQTERLNTRENRATVDFIGATRIAKFVADMCYIFLVVAAATMLSQKMLSPAEFTAAIGLAATFKGNIGLVTNYMTEFNAVKIPLGNLRRFIGIDRDRPPGQTVHGVESIEFRGVDFGYPGGARLLHNFDLTMDQKGIYLFKGESGSGKTTAANLLLNYYVPQLGEVRINGISVDAIDNLNDLVAVNRQETQILNDTIENNLTLYRPVPTAIVRDMLRKVGLGRWANADGLAREIRKGQSLSGGEEKRLSLARTCLMDRDIMIFDEPFANIDAESIDKVCERILAIQDRFVIVITHAFPDMLQSRVIQTIDFNETA
jgi:ATP-binding cassette subfamily B protein